MEVSDHPLPTPPSNPPDSFENRLPSPPRLPQEDPLSASPDLSHHTAIEAFTSDVRDQPPSPPTQTFKIDPPRADSAPQFDRPLSEPSIAMDVDEEAPMTEMVNGHKDEGEYTMEDMFSGPAVESPEPTNEPTPPPTDRIPEPTAAIQPTPSPRTTSPLPPTTSQPSVPTQTQSQPSITSTPPPPPAITTITPEIVMKDEPKPAPTKTFHKPPTPDQPPAKRQKTEPSPPTYDTSKKIPQNQQKFLVALLRQVKKAKDAGPFLQPVDPVKLNIPRYFDIVERPMDISTIEKKLNAGQYPVVQAVVDDFNLMIENCVKFNGIENPVTKMGQNIQATFEKGMKNLPPEQVYSLYPLG